jgi:acyl transferase domain-containing protein
MLGIGAPYEVALTSLLNAKNPSISFYSSVTGDKYVETISPAYWRRNMESPVLFYPAVMSYFEQSTHDTLFVEVGPQ